MRMKQVSVVEQMVEEAVSAIPASDPVARPVAEALVQNYIATRRNLPDRKSELISKQGLEDIACDSLLENMKMAI